MTDVLIKSSVEFFQRVFNKPFNTTLVERGGRIRLRFLDGESRYARVERDSVNCRTCSVHPSESMCEFYDF